MSRARNIKPAFFTNEELVELPFETRLLFIGLWTLADREGRLEDRPRRIKMAIFPADSVDVDTGLDALHEYGFIRRYAAKGVRVIQIVNFAKHQKPHPREAPSHLPGPDTPDEATPRTDQGTAEATPRHDQGTDKDMASPASSLNPHSLNPSCLNADSSPSGRENPRRGKPRQAAAPPSVGLPPGLLPDTWLAFRDHRQRLRAPLTRHAEQLLLAKLVKLGLAGHDLNAVVEQSIERGWKGFFPLNGSDHASDGINEWLNRSDAIEGEYTHDA